MERNTEVIVGGIVLAFGIVILMFVFVSAFTLVGGSGDFIRQQVPELSKKAPTCSFHWSANGLNVNFNDNSQEGSSPITDYQWQFDDGQSDSQKNPTHTYSQPRNYNVQLKVTDQTGIGAQCSSQVSVDSNGSKQGNSESSGSINIDMTSMILPIAIVLLVIGLYLTMMLVGASITKAGWNILRPRPDVVQVRVRPKDIVVEPAMIRPVAPLPPPPPQPQAQPAPPQPSQPPAPPMPSPKK